MKELRKLLLPLLIVMCTCLGACSQIDNQTINSKSTQSTNLDVQLKETKEETALSLNDIPKFTNNPYITINNNIPNFKNSDYTTESFETYSELDELGRCGVAYSNVGVDIMPTEKRGNIGSVKPSGWHTVKYDCVDGKYLYNRCHLIGYQLTGENANDKNLITGTRYMNVDGMLPFENMIADYVKETKNHVLYRVTPIFEGDNLVASGVQMEALSIEDKGESISFNVYVYNNQLGIKIDYKTGKSKFAGEKVESDTKQTINKEQNIKYILNTNTYKFHLSTCSSAKDTKPENRKNYTGERSDLISRGYIPCGRCKP